MSSTEIIYLCALDNPYLAQYYHRMAKKQSPISKEFQRSFFVKAGKRGGLKGGRNGGLLGGPARARSLSKKRRKEIASMGGKARAAKMRQEKK